MNYENQTCPICGKPLLSSDDVVVCPECATPQHRECWMQHGRCANDEKHGSGFVWKGSERETANEAQEQSRICPACGSENPPDSLHCGNCGALLGEEESNDGSPKRCRFCGKDNDSDALHCKYCGAPLGEQAGFFGGNPYIAGTGIDEKEQIGENTAGDLAIYVQASSGRYLKKFRRFEKGKKLSFNFAAFFFAPYWFFYRKLYKAGIFFMVLFATASMMLSGVATDAMEIANFYINEVYSADTENATEQELAELQKEFEKKGEEMRQKLKKPMLILVSVNAVIRLICALSADRLYYKKILADMKLISDSVKEENLRKVMIARRGGLSALSFAASLLGYNMLVSVLVFAADALMNSF
ncbi:MAG: RING finger protein [Oscillospiraceae bacterium]|nr:RING finger protein [Clostridiaceae bacterium]MDY5948425.1 RING finger protein [Oscillospiraceae bacterium]